MEEADAAASTRDTGKGLCPECQGQKDTCTCCGANRKAADDTLCSACGAGADGNSKVCTACGANLAHDDASDAISVGWQRHSPQLQPMTARELPTSRLLTPKRPASALRASLASAASSPSPSGPVYPCVSRRDKSVTFVTSKIPCLTGIGMSHWPPYTLAHLHSLLHLLLHLLHLSRHSNSKRSADSQQAPSAAPTLPAEGESSPEAHTMEGGLVQQDQEEHAQDDDAARARELGLSTLPQCMSPVPPPMPAES